MFENKDKTVRRHERKSCLLASCLLPPASCLLVPLHVRHHVVPQDEPAVVAVRTLVRLPAVVDLAVAVQQGEVRELLAADLALYHRLARRPYLRLAVAVERGAVSEFLAADLTPYHRLAGWPYLRLAVG